MIFYLFFLRVQSGTLQILQTGKVLSATYFTLSQGRKRERERKAFPVSFPCLTLHAVYTYPQWSILIWARSRSYVTRGGTTPKGGTGVFIWRHERSEKKEKYFLFRCGKTVARRLSANARYAPFHIHCQGPPPPLQTAVACDLSVSAPSFCHTIYSGCLPCHCQI